MRRVALVASMGLVLLGAAATPTAAVQGSKFRPAVESRGGIVATESREASRVGRDALNAGGNAIDAAVSAAFAIGVARPQSCGIGGGGFLVYRTAGGKTAALDFRETAPAAVTPTTFAGPGPHRTFTGHRTVGVPGTVAGLAAALDRFGTFSLEEAIAPAELLARSGFRVPASLSADMASHAARLRLFPEAAGQFLTREGAPYPAGSRLVQTDLADTLTLIARGGPDAFYRGEIARRIVQTMRTASAQLAGDVGLMTRRDLAAYEAVWRRPLLGRYRGREVIAMPPPTSGGIAILEMLNLLEGFDLARAGQSSADALHLIAESQKIAFADRGTYVADPDFVSVPTSILTSKAYANARRREIDPQRAGTYRSGRITSGARPASRDRNPNQSTTHISVVDAAGNAVALTCTIEQSFGSAVVPPGTGVLLNNQLTDFGDPGSANEPRPGKRPRSSMSPTILVERRRPVLALGGAGGVRIIMGSLLGIVNVVDFGLDIASAIDAERLDASGARVVLEAARIPEATQAELERRGHALTRAGEYDLRPRVQGAGVHLVTGRRLGVSDPRTDFATAAARRRLPAIQRWPGRPDRADPTVRLLPAEAAGTTGRFLRVRLRWSGRDRGRSGIASYAVQLRTLAGGGQSAWRTLTRGRGGTAAFFRAVRGTTYLVRVRALDRAGNASAYARLRLRVLR